MNLEDIFSTAERIKILQKIIYLEEPFGVNEIARNLSLSKGLVSKYFEILAKENILKKLKRKFIVGDNSNVKSIRIMLNIKKIPKETFKKYKFVKAVGLYGSCAKGINTASSDIDLWIKIERAKDEDIAKLTSELKKE